MVKLTMAYLTGIGYDVLGQVETTSSYQYPPPSSYLGFGRRLPDRTYRQAPYRLIVWPSAAVRYHWSHAIADSWFKAKVTTALKRPSLLEPLKQFLSRYGTGNVLNEMDVVQGCRVCFVAPYCMTQMAFILTQTTAVCHPSCLRLISLTLSRLATGEPRGSLTSAAMGIKP
ncbi:unnamed protein product [Fusarium venenatum]|uniref:Uncharacterized protein n=1 Tax=Fusarium venenatum TaxID=56646 RepID=A0A2L2SUL6_9HYPO|nr:uncharacterized protein FVRRES_05608 [Fusarium venenatum]CEI61172.1 unnamed protein product [Fusarium venenatum]